VTEPLTIDEVRHVATLARLRLTDDQLDRYRAQLSSVLGHIAKLSELDVDDVEPLAHSSDLVNRLDDDRPAESLGVKQVLAIAPAVQEQFLAVPKVFGEDSEG
jgi:aspartyl-tRNA(Asn)/glutamyl-tRNA(Gln) amidotransferase subunit C